MSAARPSVIADFPVAILAGGLATRLRPITQQIPKSLVEVAGEPFLAHQLHQLKAQGIRKVVLCLGHLGGMIEEKFGDGRAWGVELQYSYDGETLRGTGGALARALPLLGSAFFVLYGDSFLPVEFTEVLSAFQKSGKQALMTVFPNSDAWDKSNVRFEDGKLLEYDKHAPSEEMRHIDYGLGLFKEEAFASMRECPIFDLALLQTNLVAQGEMAGMEVSQRFYEIGSHSGLEELNKLLAKPQKQALFPSRLGMAGIS